MADQKRLTDPTQNHFVVSCPACKQKYLVQGIMVQTSEEMACAQCNALFQLKIEGGRVESRIVTPPTGGRFGPAEGPLAGRH